MTTLAERWRALSSATVHEAAGRTGALPMGIKPLAPHVKVAGPAFPVVSPPGDNLWLHRAIYAASPGDVLIVDVGDGPEFGYWGEVMAVAAQARDLAGLIISGGVRDSQRMVEIGFPVCSAAVAIQGTGKDPDGLGSLGSPVVLGGVTIRHGDFVLGDADGVIVIERERAETVVAESEARDEKEQAIFARLRAGESSIDIYDLLREQAA